MQISYAELANNLAVAAPIPLDAPVIKAIGLVIDSTSNIFFAINAFDEIRQ